MVGAKRQLKVRTKIPSNQSGDLGSGLPALYLRCTTINNIVLIYVKKSHHHTLVLILSYIQLKVLDGMVQKKKARLALRVEGNTNGATHTSTVVVQQYSMIVPTTQWRHHTDVPHARDTTRRRFEHGEQHAIPPRHATPPPSLSLLQPTRQHCTHTSSTFAFVLEIETKRTPENICKKKGSSRLDLYIPYFPKTRVTVASTCMPRQAQHTNIHVCMHSYDRSRGDMVLIMILLQQCGPCFGDGAWHA